MRVLRLTLCVILFSTFANFSAAQTTSAPSRDPQALAVLNQCLNAAGGLTAIGAIQDYTASGNITYYWAGQQVQAGVTVRGKGIGEFRLDASLPNGTRTWAADGVSGTLIAPDGNRHSSAPYNLTTAGSMTLPYLRIAAILADSSTSISYVGPVTIDGQQTYQIHFVLAVDTALATIGPQPGLGVFDLYLDPTSFLVTKLTETVGSDSDFRTGYVHEIDFTNYQTIGNVVAPFTITEKIGGQSTWSITLDSMTFNAGLADSVFNP